MIKMITYPLNNIDYTAEDAELYFSTRESGVYDGNDFEVTVSGIDNDVTVGTGIAWIHNTKFSGKVVALKEPQTLTLSLPNSVYDRIDAIVIQFDANENATEIVVKEGIASSTPVAPNVVRTESLYELHIFHIQRQAGATVISVDDLIDLRNISDYCGIMFDPISSVDPTLTKNGYAADAKATGDEIKAAKNAAESALTEIIPIERGGTGKDNVSDAFMALSHSSGNLGYDIPIDFDNISTYGFIWCATTNNDNNSPWGSAAGHYGWLENYPTFQRFSEFGANNVYTRYHANGIWNPWFRNGGEDFVVAQGESGSWTYRKWNSGRAELWARIAYTVKLVANAPVEVWINNSFPFQFTTEPSCHINLNHHSTNNHWLVEAKAYTGILSMVKIVSFVSGDAAGMADVYISGKWK